MKCISSNVQPTKTEHQQENEKNVVGERERERKSGRVGERE